jgi:hypothetical protein
VFLPLISNRLYSSFLGASLGAIFKVNIDGKAR